ncbi:MAG: hypothetical protein AAFV95_23525 [Bacteroidota bacterium]
MAGQQSVQLHLADDTSAGWYVLSVQTPLGFYSRKLLVMPRE